MKRWPLPLVASFVLFLALCASLAYWALQFFAPSQRPVAAAPASVAPPADLSAAASLFGGSGNTALASNFILQGVVLSGSSGQSIAILSANGEPAKAVAMDMEIVPGITVKEVHRSYVLLDDHGALKRVELPLEPALLGSGSAAPVFTSPADSAGTSVDGASATSNSAAGRRRMPLAMPAQPAPPDSAPAPAQQEPTSAQPSQAESQSSPSPDSPGQSGAGAGVMSAAPAVSAQPAAEPSSESP